MLKTKPDHCSLGGRSFQPGTALLQNTLCVWVEGHSSLGQPYCRICCVSGWKVIPAWDSPTAEYVVCLGGRSFQPGTALLQNTLCVWVEGHSSLGQPNCRIRCVSGWKDIPAWDSPTAEYVVCLENTQCLDVIRS